MVYHLCHLAHGIVKGQVRKGFKLGCTNGFCYAEMHPSLGLTDARNDAVDVFARLFYVGFVRGLRHFARLKQVARLVFVAHGHGYDVQLGQRSELIAHSRKREHLYKCGFGSV